MKILLTMNLPWFPAVGGANKCNRALAEGLAARGHEVLAVVPALAVPSRWTREEVRDELRARGIEVREEGGVDRFRSGGVEVVAVADPARLRGELTERLQAFRPDRILASSEDPSQNLLDAALKAQAAPVIYLSHTPAFLPFGPQAFYPSERRARMLSQVAGIVTVSRFVADYIRRWGGLEAEVFSFPIYGEGPFPDFGSGGNGGDGFVTLINPCAVKGISIFLELARSLPDVRFAAVPTWGTTPADREALAALPNVTLLAPVDDIDRIYERTRVLLMPSLWEEAFGVTAVEAMLRGLPVLASDAGGLPEAKQGTDFVLPVRPIERFTDRQDANEVTEPEVPEQDAGPWREALLRLLGDRELYARQSAAAREAAHRFVAGLGIEPFEEMMRRMEGKKTGAPAVAAPQPPSGDEAAGELESLTPEQRALLMLRLRKKAAQKSPEEGGLPPIPRASRPPEIEELPLSFAQQRLWFLDQWQPGNPVYNLPAAVRLSGPLDAAAFHGALREIARRHEALRTAFPTVEGRPVQVISPEPDLAMPRVDLAALPEAAREAEIRRLIEEEAGRSFDLSTGPLWRAVLLRTGAAEHVVVVNLHHIVADGWSIGVLIRELATIYGAWRERRPHGLPELPVQYADFAVWQRGRLQGEELEKALAWWRERLAGLPPVLEIPADRPRPATPTFRGGRRPVRLDAGLWSEARSFSQRQGTTPFMTALAAFLALLGRVTGQTDVAVGSPIANRNRQETEGLIGFFVNTLVLRADLGGDPGFRELVARVREATLGAYAHQDLPFEEVVKAVGGERDLSHNPLFQVMFALHNTPAATPAIAGVDLSFLDLFSNTAKFDFDLMGVEDGRTLGGAVEFSLDLFDAPTVDRLLAHWETLLRGALAAPEAPLADLPLLGTGERHQLLTEWNDTDVDFPREVGLQDLFAARAAEAPEAPAVMTDPEDGEDGESVTYRELLDRVQELAARLRGMGVLPGDRVGLCVDRSPAMVSGLMAIAAAGAAYVPLDPAYPAARLALMAADARPRAVIAEEKLAGLISGSGAPVIPPGTGDFEGGAGPRPFPPVTMSPELPAYVIYTSGSTGTPKGVMVDHRGRVNNFLDFNRRFGVGRGDRLLAVSALGFDMTAYDVFGTLAAGAAIVLPRAADAFDPARWAELMIRERVTLWHSAPALLELLVQHLEATPPAAPLALRLVLLGGDWIPLSLPDRIRRFAPAATVISLGGATEVSMDSTIYRVDEVRPEWTSIPYGRPMWNQTAWVVDPGLRPQPIGIPGELLLGGAGVGHGYFGQPDLTASKFVPDPFSQTPGGRLYRTGDLARFRPDGQLELLGRIDFQVKVRGVRIELGEITAALSRHQAVKEAVVVARRDGSGARLAARLIAYVVPRKPVETAELATFLEARLPRAMVPAAWVLLDALPLSPNGKVDRRALPDPAPDSGRAARAYVEPRTAVESVIAGVWGDLLGAEKVGAESHFFELGGHSLLATQAVSRLRSLLQIELPLRALLENPTVAGTAAAAEARARAERIELEEIATTVLLLSELSEDDVQRMLAERAGGEAEEALS